MQHLYFSLRFSIKNKVANDEDWLVEKILSGGLTFPVILVLWELQPAANGSALLWLYLLWALELPIVRLLLPC